ncbi:MAG: hypothetical protein M3464_18450 [Chloroflexota bacterium]|nr:hypothetical protein [Chloroflexota bacterium]
MDGQWFDELTTAFVTSRRGALRFVLAGAGGAAALRLGLGEAAAACRKPGKPCDKKKHTCCGGAKCKAGMCKCKGAPACYGTCCEPGQICLNDIGCVNGPLETGDHCNPKKRFGCQSGICACISNTEIGTVCTCREHTCAHLTGLCAKTSDCCLGGCSGFTHQCEVIE